MQSESITLTSRISFWMHFRATRAVLSRLWTTYVAWGIFVGIPFLLVIVMLCCGQDISEPGIWDLPAWAILLGGFLFMGGLIPLIQMFNVSSMRCRNPSIDGVQTYTITQDGYTVQGNLFDTTLKWNAFLKAIETKHFILLYISTRWAHFIPKAAATEDDLKAIRAILHKNLGPKTKLKNA